MNLVTQYLHLREVKTALDAQASCVQNPLLPMMRADWLALRTVRHNSTDGKVRLARHRTTARQPSSGCKATRRLALRCKLRSPPPRQSFCTAVIAHKQPRHLFSCTIHVHVSQETRQNSWEPWGISYHRGSFLRKVVFSYRALRARVLLQGDLHP